MFESKYNKFLTGALIVIIIAILGLLGYLGYNYFQELQSTEEAAKFVDGYQGDESSVDDSEDNEYDGDNPLKSKDSNNDEKKRVKKKYKGFNVDGTMKIPKINFSYPVLEKVTTKALESSVAVLCGSGLNQVGNTVIIGHNYRNGQFFSNNKKLSKGDKIYITDYQGVQKTYVIYNKFETTPEDTSFYQRDTNGKAEITLSTCTDDSKARLIIFAKEE